MRNHRLDRCSLVAIGGRPLGANRGTTNMELTYIGAIQLVIGIALLLGGSLRAIVFFLLLSGLFAGSAAIWLPALGGSSIPPTHFALIFVILRVLAPKGGFMGLVPEAIAANRWLVLFIVYGVVIAVVGPRMFAGDMNVSPMRMNKSFDLFDTVSLVPSAQNFTAAFYLVGTMLMAIVAYIVCRSRGGANMLVSAAITVGWLHLAIGMISLLARGTPLDGYLDLLRNGNYAQLDQAFRGFVRIRGIFPEASAYANFGFVYFVLNAELWYRSIRPLPTGLVAFGLALILFFSTSSTAYIGLAAYAVFFLLRALVLPKEIIWPQMYRLALAMLAISVITSSVFLLFPELIQTIGAIVTDMTIGKSDSASAQQRLFWATQGWDAFKISYGIGIGPGSFRSSSMVMAIIGTTGIIGSISFAAYIVGMYQPWRRSTFVRVADPEQSLGGTFATAALLAVVPLAVSSSQADPGINFAMLSGAALALRRRGDALPHDGGIAAIATPASPISDPAARSGRRRLPDQRSARVR